MRMSRTKSMCPGCKFESMEYELIKIPMPYGEAEYVGGKA
jgi:hypothetical protein